MSYSLNLTALNLPAKSGSETFSTSSSTREDSSARLKLASSTSSRLFLLARSNLSPRPRSNSLLRPGITCLRRARTSLPTWVLSFLIHASNRRFSSARRTTSSTTRRPSVSRFRLTSMIRAAASLGWPENSFTSAEVTRRQAGSQAIDIGRPSQAVPVTPPCIRVRTRRFGWFNSLPGTVEVTPVR